MNFFRGLIFSLSASCIFWGSVIYLSYHYGFRDGVESEQSVIAHANLKLSQCNGVISGGLNEQ